MSSSVLERKVAEGSRMYENMAMRFLMGEYGIIIAEDKGAYNYVGHGFDERGGLKKSGDGAHVVMDTEQVLQKIEETAEEMRAENEQFAGLHGEYKRHYQWGIRESVLGRMSALRLEYLTPKNQEHYEGIRQFIEHKGLMDRKDSEVDRTYEGFSRDLEELREGLMKKQVDKSSAFYSLEGLVISVKGFAERFSAYDAAHFAGKSLDSMFDHTSKKFHEILASIDHAILTISRSLGLRYSPVSLGLGIKGVGYALLWGYKKRHGDNWIDKFIEDHGEKKFFKYFDESGNPRRAELSINRLRKQPFWRRRRAPLKPASAGQGVSKQAVQESTS